jgi:signal transduction histidine kinase
VLSAILKTEESERQKFARELHDGLGPLLSSIKMSVLALVPGETDPGHLKILDNTSRLIDESVNTIKEISNHLSPHVLDHFGLPRAINSFIDRIGVTDVLSLKVNSNTEGLRFDTSIEMGLYRVVCELINNTITHARATEVNIDLYYDNGLLTLDYYDNGRGFDPDEVLHLQPGMGYSNIQSRIKSIHGTIEVISQPDKGVCISVAIKTEAHG